MELFSIQCFIEIGRSGSFSAAANNLYRTQSAVSQQIKSLEAELEVKLIDRSGRRIEITEAGRKFEIHAKKLISEYHNLRNLFSDNVAEPEGSVRIASNNSLTEHLIIPRMAELHKQYPGVSMSIANKRSPEIMRLVRVGEYDLGIGYRLLHVRGMKTIVLHTSRFVEIRSQEMKTAMHSLIHFEKDEELRRYIAKYDERVSSEHQIHELASFNSILSLVSAGVGFSIVPDYVAAQHTHLMAIPLDNIPPVDICLYHWENRSLSTAARLFKELCIQ